MKKIPKILLSRIIGLMIFLIILGVLNLVHVNLRVYSIWVSFLNDNAVLLIIMSLIFMIAEIFFELISLKAWLQIQGHNRLLLDVL